MKNKIHKIIAITIFFVLMTGCVVISLNPIYHEKDLVLNNEMVGEWVGARSIWNITKDVGLSYLLTYKECAEPINDPSNYSTCTLASFKINLIKIDGIYFADFYPINYSNTDNQLLLFHLRAYNSFAKIEIENNELNVSFLDDEWFENLVEKSPKEIDHLETYEGVMITASTDQLQDFISTYAKDKEAFSNTISVKR